MTIRATPPTSYFSPHSREQPQSICNRLQTWCSQLFRRTSHREVQSIGRPSDMIQRQIERTFLSINFSWTGEKLSEGGEGDVWKVVKQTNAHPVYCAVKLLHNKASCDQRGKRYVPKRVEEGKGEILLSKFKKNAHILQVELYLLANEQNTVYFIENADNYFGYKILGIVTPCYSQDLLNYRKNAESIPIDKVISITRQILQALQVLHEARIMHRDVKLENVFIDASDKVVLGDFGLAIDFSVHPNIVDCVGTLAYAAPEVLFNPEKRPYTEKIDLWSFGVLLLFFYSNLLLTTHAICSQRQQWIREIQYPSLNNLLFSLFSDTPKNRPSAERVLQAEFYQKTPRESENQDFSSRSLSTEELLIFPIDT